MATDNKYDRQIRLWGTHGQRRLAESHILLLGGSPVGVETLKNLVLPGIGKFTIVDDKQVELRDLGNNFFVSEEALGQPRAQNIRDLLVEMNPDVQGHYIVYNPLNYIQSRENLKQYTFIVCNDQDLTTLLELSQACAQLQKKYIILNTNGMIGYLRSYGDKHTIIESKPANVSFDDLRLNKPFAQLTDFAFSLVNIEQMSDYDRSHVPYVVILIQWLNKWKQDHNGQLPQNLAEKNQFKDILQKAGLGFVTQKVEGQDVQIQITFDNFKEAIKNAYKCYQDISEINFSVQQLFDAVDSHHEKDPNNLIFWALVKALQQFYEEHHTLPLTGKIGDMTTKSQTYQQLLDIYHQKFQEDKLILRKYLNEIFKTEDSLIFVSDQQLKIFQENSQQIEWINYKPFHEEFQNPKPLDWVDGTIHNWYLGTMGYLIFQQRYNRFPSQEVQGDDQLLLQIINQEVVDQKFNNTFQQVDEMYVKELCRYEGCQIHNVASFLGGVASQEAIKLITHQFTPLNNTFIFTGISTEGGSFEF